MPIVKGLSADATTTAAKPTFDLGAIGTSLVNSIISIGMSQSDAAIAKQVADEQYRLAQLGYQGEQLKAELQANLAAMGLSKAQIDASIQKTQLANTIVLAVLGVAVIGGGAYLIMKVNKRK